MTISLISMVTSVGVALGPTLAGVLINYWGWRAIFFFNVPVALVDLFLVIKYVPVKILCAGQKLDVLGLACASIGHGGPLDRLQPRQRTGLDLAGRHRYFAGQHSGHALFHLA